MRYIVHAGCLAIVLVSAAKAEAPEGVVVPGSSTVATLHAKGEQIYQCQAGTDGALSWQFREPIATLLENGQVVGKHFGGPTWTLDDGSSVVGKVTGRAPAATSRDIPLLRLEVVSRAGNGWLDTVVAI